MTPFADDLSGVLFGLLAAGLSLGIARRYLRPVVTENTLRDIAREAGFRAVEAEERAQVLADLLRMAKRRDRPRPRDAFLRRARARVR